MPALQGEAAQHRREHDDETQDDEHVIPLKIILFGNFRE
jgi:hypothetical protein